MPSAVAASGSKSPEITSAASTPAEDPAAENKTHFIPGAPPPTDAATKIKKRKSKKKQPKQNAEATADSPSTPATADDGSAAVGGPADQPATQAVVPKLTDDLKELYDNVFPKNDPSAERNEPALGAEQLQPNEDGVLPHLTTGDPVTLLLNKRLRTIQKRKLRLDKISEAIAQGKKLNVDQEASYKDKNYVEGLLKELTDAWNANTLRLEQEKRASKEKEAAQKAKIESLLVDAKELGIQVGQDKVYTLIRFLRTASIKRHVTAQTPKGIALFDGFEALLAQVYAGTDDAVDAVNNLFEGSESLVAESTVSFKEIREVSKLPEDVILAGKDTEEPEESTEKDDAAELDESANSAPAKKVTQISFLQESELEETVAPSNEESAANTAEGAAESPSTATADTITTETAAAYTPVSQAAPVSAPASTETESTSTTAPTSETKPKKKKYYHHRRNNKNANGSANANANGNANTNGKANGSANGTANKPNKPKPKN